jgi:hypothetical protein
MSIVKVAVEATTAWILGSLPLGVAVGRILRLRLAPVRR